MNKETQRVITEALQDYIQDKTGLQVSEDIYDVLYSQLEATVENAMDNPAQEEVDKVYNLLYK